MDALLCGMTPHALVRTSVVRQDWDPSASRTIRIPEDACQHNSKTAVAANKTHKNRLPLPHRTRRISAHGASCMCGALRPAIMHNYQLSSTHTPPPALVAPVRSDT
jgi:hypothetical protein